jgi:predicted ATPase/DNA-binding CsgD family transcriptional regulator
VASDSEGALQEFERALTGRGGNVAPSAAAALTSFIGRAGEIDDVSALLGKHRLVAVTGPGGVGKTRLAGEVMSRVTDRYADGVWLVELASVQEPALVTRLVAAALGVREQPGSPLVDVLTMVLSRQQLLLVLDNCEHVLGAAAALCAALLPVADDLRILATSREPLRVAGEARYRLAPLRLPSPSDGAAAAESEAVALFTDRARRADPDFAVTDVNQPAVARLVSQLDGLPLAIELAAARADVLGVTQLVDRLDDRFTLLVGADRLAAGRQQSLTATVDWSYQLLTEAEQQVFRRLSVFPAGFTLQAAEAVAGRDAVSVVLRLVDCSLIAPPRQGPDGGARYLMLETVRGYAATIAAEGGDQAEAATSLAAYAVAAAEQAAAGMDTSSTEPAAVRLLDAEDATMRQALAWAMDHDSVTALRLAVALAPWWVLRGRSAAEYPVLREAARHAAPGSELWCAAQQWLGPAALLAGDLAASLDHHTEVCDALAGGPPSRALANCLSGQSAALSNMGRIPEAIAAGRHSLEVARQLDYPAGQALALASLAIPAYYSGDVDGALRLLDEAGQVQGDFPGWVARAVTYILATVQIEAGELAAAERTCDESLVRAREVGDLQNQAAALVQLAVVGQRAGRTEPAAARLREALPIALRAGGGFELCNGLDCCGHLCAAARRPGDAVTVWAAHAALLQQHGIADAAPDAQRRQEPLRKARRALGSDGARAAEARGTSMSMTTAVEYAILLSTPGEPPDETLPGAVKLSGRERELVALVAQGRTDAQIAAELYISIRTVSSHLDRIRDKTGCRRRADLTRLALAAGLV